MWEARRHGQAQTVGDPAKLSEATGMHVFGFIAPDKYVLYCSVPETYEVCREIAAW